MTERSPRQRPALPARFYEPERRMVLLWFAYSFALFFGCGYASYAIAMSSLTPALKVVGVAVFTLLASNGLHLLGWMAHEGIHLSLARNKHVSVLLGSFAGSVLFFPAVGLGISHWPHHRFTNSEDDPDTVIQARHQTFWRRVLLARICANREYLRNAVAVALRKPLPDSFRMPLSRNALARHAQLGFAFMALWLCAYGILGASNPRYLLLACVAPYLTMIPLTGMRVYIEHAGTQPDEFLDARSYTAPFYTALLFGNNYHLEHHLYPRVPGYKLPSVHRMLRDAGYFERFRAHIVPGVLAPLRYVGSRFVYPSHPGIGARIAAGTAHESNPSTATPGLRNG